MDRSKYVRIKFTEIPQEFIEEYDLSKAVQNGWIYFEILRGCYGLPQSGQLANDLLRTPLEKAGYIMNPPQHRAYGATSGVPFNSFYSWTTSALNISARNTLYIS